MSDDHAQYLSVCGCPSMRETDTAPPQIVSSPNLSTTAMSSREGAWQKSSRSTARLSSIFMAKNYSKFSCFLHRFLAVPSWPQSSFFKGEKKNTHWPRKSCLTVTLIFHKVKK